MDANSISEHSIEKFVRKIFNSDRNFESLTKADLRNKYIKEKGITEFSVEEKKLFSSVVNEVFDEFTKSTKTSNKGLLDEASYDSKKKSGKSKSATSKWKIVNSDDEDDSGMFDSGHNKENVESVEIDKNTSAKDGDFSDADVSKSCDSGSPLVLESQIKLDDRKQVDNAKLKDLPNNGIESHHVESSSEAGSSDDDFVMKKNSKKAKTQQLNSSVFDSDSDDNSNAEGNNRDQDGAAPARKQKKTRQEIKQKTNKKRKVSESDSESSDQSLTSNEKKKSKLETSRKRKAQKPFDLQHQNGSDTSSGNESESEFREEKNNRKNKQSKLDEAPKNSKNKRKIYESDGENSAQVSMSNENKKSKTKNKFKTSKKRKIQKPFDLQHQNGSDTSSGNESESEFREEKTNGKNRKSKPSEASKKSKPSEASKKSKNSPPSNNRIEHLKKYLRAAGLRVQSYNKLFESCRSQKAKVEKLLEVLQNAGLKGRPTLEKCKKLKKKIEEKKDIESLDLTNIIETTGRPRRNTSKLHSSPSLMETTEAPPANHFSNLKGIVDSDDSDAPVKTSSRKRTVIDDDSF